MGQAYNACYSRNKTYDMPIIGLRYAEKKGCALADHCDSLQKIECFNRSGLVVDCEFACCVENECNLGTLIPLTIPPVTTSPVDVTESSTSPFFTTQEAHTPTVFSTGCRSFEWLCFRLLMALNMLLLAFY